MELTAPAIVGYENLGYERVPNFGDFQPIAKNREFFVGNTVVGGLTKPLVAIRQLQNQIDWIEQVYQFYGGYNDSKLTNTASAAKADHDTINGMIIAYENDPTGSFTWPKLPSLDNGTPELEYEIKHSQGHGGGGGGPFDDVNVDTAIPQQTRISAIQLRSGKRIDKLITTYANTSTSWTTEHGGNGGGLSNKLNLKYGNVVLNVDGRSGSRVDHLTFKTSNGDVLDGGGDGGGAFSFALPGGSFLLGFAGRSGSELDQIQFVYGNFLPARWTPIPA
ncbi:MAG TPA: jacalin-like lectin [Pseudolabrys sp.]|nr:jacalin-like lectin [Pseudolabrys sp.]